jgi:hypothetical protein
MFSNLLGRTSGGSSGNNANKTMDTLRELEDNGDGFVEVTQPEADMVTAASPQVTNAAKVPPTASQNQKRLVLNYFWLPKHPYLIKYFILNQV